MGRMNSVMRLRRVRLLQRLIEARCSETLLPAAVAYNFEAHMRETIHAERVLAPVDRSIIRPATKGPRSLMRTSMLRPVR